MDNSKFNLQKFVISVILIGITLVLGIYIVDGIGNTTLLTSVVTDTSATSVTNVTLWSNQTNIINDFSTVPLGAVSPYCSLNTVSNASNVSQIIGSSNYTFISVNCTVQGVGSSLYENSSASINYTLVYSTYDQSAAYNASIVVSSALSNGTSWISILVVVGFATIILTMLTSGLGKATEESQTPYY
jgi:hypothetical protein